MTDWPTSEEVGERSTVIDRALLKVGSLTVRLWKVARRGYRRRRVEQDVFGREDFHLSSVESRLLEVVKRRWRESSEVR